MTNRRIFLRNCFNGTLAAALTPGYVLAGLNSDKPAIHTDRHQQLQQSIGTYFVVKQNGRQLTRLRLSHLMEVTSDPRLDQFYLYFTNTSTISLEESCYELQHPQLGQQQIFLQAIPGESFSQHYRATFSLLMDNHTPVTRLRNIVPGSNPSFLKTSTRLLNKQES